MGEELGADYRVVEARLSALEKLLTELDAQIGPLRGVRQRQGAGMWGNVPACQSFASSYTATLGTLESKLLAMRTEVGTLQKALADSVANLKQVDANIQARLEALAKKFDEGAPAGPMVCTPYDTVPDSLVVFPSAAPTPSPAPAPTPTPTPTPSPSPAPRPTAPGGGGW